MVLIHRAQVCQMRVLLVYFIGMLVMGRNPFVWQTCPIFSQDVWLGCFHSGSQSWLFIGTIQGAWLLGPLFSHPANFDLIIWVGPGQVSLMCHCSVLCATWASKTRSAAMFVRVRWRVLSSTLPLPARPTRRLVQTIQKSPCVGLRSLKPGKAAPRRVEGAP